MRNQVQKGDAIDVTLSATKNPGDGYLVGSMFGVLGNGGNSGDQDVLWLVGCFTLPKHSAEAWTFGELLYWDDTNKYVTTTPTNNTKIGVATAAAANPSSTGQVRLSGAFGI